MKRVMVRTLALVLALMLALPALVLADDDTGVLSLPDSGIDLGDLGELEIPELDGDLPGDMELTLELDGDEEIEIQEDPGAFEEPIDIGEDTPGAESTEEPIEVPSPESTDETVPEATADEGGALAGNEIAGVVDSIPYVDAEGRSMEPAYAAFVIGGNENKVLGSGWYAVVEDKTFTEGMIITGAVDLILCDGTTLNAMDGIWVQKNAKLTIWAQSTGNNAGKLVARGGEGKAGIGGIKDEVAGTIVINGGVISAEGGADAAGIGGGYRQDSGFIRVEINGGQVTATGHASVNANSAAGIGPGYHNAHSGDIAIKGGRVEAKGDNGGGICGPMSARPTASGSSSVRRPLTP